MPSFSQGEKIAFANRVRLCAIAMGVTEAEATLALRQLCEKKAVDCGKDYHDAVIDSAVNGAAVPTSACAQERLEYLALFDQ